MFLNKGGAGEVGTFPLFSPSKNTDFRNANLTLSNINPYKLLHSLRKILARRTLLKSPHASFQKHCFGSEKQRKRPMLSCGNRNKVKSLKIFSILPYKI